MTNRPAAPRLLMRHHRDTWRKPQVHRLLGTPVDMGPTVVLGWDGPRMVILDLEGVRPEWAADLLQATADAMRIAAAHQEEAAS